MIQLTPHMRILLHRGPVDFRKGIDGLVHLCKERMGRDPFSGALFVFRNRRRTGIKILVYDGQGFWLCHKRLSQGRFNGWPSEEDCGGAELDSHHLQVLLAAGNPSGIRFKEFWRKLDTGGASL